MRVLFFCPLYIVGCWEKPSTTTRRTTTRRITVSTEPPTGIKLEKLSTNLLKRERKEY